MKDRIKTSEETYKIQKQYIDSVMPPYELMIDHDPDGIFWTSQIKLPGLEDYPFYFTSGKGLSEYDCLASNYGELIERYSWFYWHNDVEYNKKYIDNKIKVKNLFSGIEYLVDFNEFMIHEGRQDYLASGNTEEEAIYHALTEAYEYAFLKNNYSHSPIEHYIVSTEKMFPELHEKIHDNFQVVVRRDPRMMLYDVTAYKAPLPDATYMPIYIEPRNPIVFNDVVEHFSPSVGDSNGGKVWPPVTGSRAGVNLKDTIKIAMAEMVQNHYLLKFNGFIHEDIKFPKQNLRKKEPSGFIYKDATELKDFSQKDLSETTMFILANLAEIDYQVWGINVSPSDCPITTMKIITDYSIGRDNPHSWRFLNKLFNI